MAISNAIGSTFFDISVSLGLSLLIFTHQRGPLTDVGGANITSSTLLLFATLSMVLLLLSTQRFKAGQAFGAFLTGLYGLYVVAAYMGVL